MSELALHPVDESIREGLERLDPDTHHAWLRRHYQFHGGGPVTMCSSTLCGLVTRKATDESDR